MPPGQGYDFSSGRGLDFFPQGARILSGGMPPVPPPQFPQQPIEQQNPYTQAFNQFTDISNQAQNIFGPYGDIPFGPTGSDISDPSQRIPFGPGLGPTTSGVQTPASRPNTDMLNAIAQGLAAGLIDPAQAQGAFGGVQVIPRGSPTDVSPFGVGIQNIPTGTPGRQASTGPPSNVPDPPWPWGMVTAGQQGQFSGGQTAFGTAASGNFPTQPTQPQTVTAPKGGPDTEQTIEKLLAAAGIPTRGAARGIFKPSVTPRGGSA